MPEKKKKTEKQENPTTMRLPKELIDQVDELAEKTHRSRTGMFIELVTQAIKNYNGK